MAVHTSVSVLEGLAADPTPALSPRSHNQCGSAYKSDAGSLAAPVPSSQPCQTSASRSPPTEFHPQGTTRTPARRPEILFSEYATQTLPRPGRSRVHPEASRLERHTHADDFRGMPLKRFDILDSPLRKLPGYQSRSLLNRAPPILHTSDTLRSG